MKKRMIALLAAAALLVGCIVGGTIAWLTDTTDAVVNTFTVGNVDITLNESDADGDQNNLINSYKMVPGNTLAKDPTITVEGGSEDCWLFVKVDEAGSAKVDENGTEVEKTFDDFITYTIVAGWTKLDAVEGDVYFCKVGASDADQVFTVLTDNEVTVNEEVTKEMMDALEAEGSELPTLTFTAYAVQKANIASAAEAWETLFPTTP